MHTVQAAMVFSVVFFVLCGIICMNPKMYWRTHEIAELSVEAQDACNRKSKMFEVFRKSSENNHWQIENSCPEKAYRLSRGVRDSVGILLG